MIIGRNTSGTHGFGAIIASYWVQLALIVTLAIIAPAIVLYPNTLPGTAGFRPLVNSIIGAVVAAIGGLFFIRRVTAYPGVRTFGFVLPTFAATYAIVVTIFFSLRIDYGRLYFGASFLVSILITYLASHMVDQYIVPTFYVVPFGHTNDLLQIGRVNWIVLQTPSAPCPPRSAIVADLRHDFDPAWERMLAEAALRGHPVYHSKQLGESLTGRVSISHLSENSFGSLLPNLGYRNVKRLVDFVGALLLLPVLVLPIALIALLIRLDSPGGAFFRQRRIGFRGQEFSMIKFRTMHARSGAMDAQAARRDAMTELDDARVTRVGRFLRRTRMDELPQVFNVLRGEMSFIGPRPEAVALSNWYQEELAFYLYRHIVRPGITGWAQVNQGHVTDIDSVSQKLNYDFFYIKNFSSWLDILIVLKTIHTIITGFGSK